MTRRIIISAIIGLLFLYEAMTQPISLISDAVGIAAGAGLAQYSAALTLLQVKEACVFYRPNAWIGSLVALLFLIRFASRFYLLFQSGAFNRSGSHAAQSFHSFNGNSWAAGLLLILFAYYVTYYLLIMRKSARLPAETGVHRV
ncbi:MAG: hypothetical protein ABF868_04415 [Sporolactobacillus sp.]